jgi:hypothetical protein
MPLLLRAFPGWEPKVLTKILAFPGNFSYAEILRFYEVKSFDLPRTGFRLCLGEDANAKGSLFPPLWGEHLE